MTSLTDTAAQLSYQGLRLQVTAQSSHLRWLEEFLCPHFQGDEEARPAAVGVTLLEDDAAYAGLERGGPREDGKHIDCFALDSEVIRLPLWNRGTGVAVFDRDYRAFYRRDAKGDVAIVTSADNRAIRTPLMRVVRELAMNHCHARGGLFLHAAAVSAAGRGLILTGRKAAGKTTLLLYLLRTGAVQYVANDRVLIPNAQVSATMFGLPSVATIRQPTLTLLEGLGDRLLASGFRQQLTLAEARQQPSGSVRSWKDGRYGMTPAQLCALVDAAAEASATASAIVFPHVTDRPGRVELRRLSLAEATERLPASLLGAGTWRKSSDFFCTPMDQVVAPDEAVLASLCAALASRVPAFECRLGLDAYVDARGARQLLALLEQPAVRDAVVS